jgi:transcriptional regulator with XRE-family HTH domain
MPTSGRHPEGDSQGASDAGDGAPSEHSDFPDVGAFIRTQRERAKLSVRKLAELAEVSNPYLSQIERGLRKPSAEVLQQVAHALRISVESLYVRAGILANEARSVSTVPEAIEADPALTPEQKLALRNVYDSFVGTR